MSARPMYSWQQLSDANRALGAGPLWGRPAAAVLVLVYGASFLLVCRSGWLALPGVVVCAVAGGGIVLAVAGRWIRGVDFNAWVEAEPRHRRGSCQWLIWRGEYSGRPCLACLASMPRRERRHWMASADSPAVAAGWLGDHVGSNAKQLRDAGVVEAGWLVWHLLPVGLLGLAVHQWTSVQPADRETALPLALATVLTAAIALHRDRRTAAPEQGDEPGGGVGVCESCGRMLAAVTVRFPDGVLFAVCGTCLAAGVHGPAPAPAGSTSPRAGDVSW